MKRIIFLLIPVFFLSCLQKIETGKTLDAKTLRHIRSLGLLDKDEEIIYFYSNFEKEKAGSFITEKRIAHYWLQGSKEERDTTSCLYKDIVAIDTIYHVPDFDCPYMEITSKAGWKFRAYVDGKYTQKKMFFEKALELWKKHRE